MASREAIAIKTEQAIARIERATFALAERLALTPLDLPKSSRFPEMLHAEQLEQIASWLEGISVPVASTTVEIDPTYLEDAAITETIADMPLPAKRSHQRKR